MALRRRMCEHRPEIASPAWAHVARRYRHTRPRAGRARAQTPRCRARAAHHRGNRPVARGPVPRVRGPEPAGTEPAHPSARRPPAARRCRRPTSARAALRPRGATVPALHLLWASVQHGCCVRSAHQARLAGVLELIGLALGEAGARLARELGLAGGSSPDTLLRILKAPSGACSGATGPGPGRR